MTLKWNDMETIDEVRELEQILLKYPLILKRNGYHAAVMIKGSRGKYLGMKKKEKVNHGNHRLNPLLQTSST